MDYRSRDDKSDILTKSRRMTNLSLLHSPLHLSGTDEAIDNLIAEGGDSFYNYVDWIGLINDPDLIVLSAVHHYYFDNDDLRDTNTVINLKQLNLIKYIDIFIHSIFKIMPQKSNFVGCFVDQKTQYENTINNITSQYQVRNNVDPFENGITSRVSFVNTIYNLMDSKTNRYMTKDNVNLLLKRQGFKVLDMTDLNGLTYFHSQKHSDYKN
jgi:hypothetical protein